MINLEIGGDFWQRKQRLLQIEETVFIFFNIL